MVCAADATHLPITALPLLIQKHPLSKPVIATKGIVNKTDALSKDARDTYYRRAGHGDVVALVRPEDLQLVGVDVEELVPGDQRARGVLGKPIIVRELENFDIASRASVLRKGLVGEKRQQQD